MDELKLVLARLEIEPDHLSPKANSKAVGKWVQAQKTKIRKARYELAQRLRTAGWARVERGPYGSTVPVLWERSSGVVCVGGRCAAAAAYRAVAAATFLAGGPAGVLPPLRLERVPYPPHRT